MERMKVNSPGASAPEGSRDGSWYPDRAVQELQLRAPRAGSVSVAYHHKVLLACLPLSRQAEFLLLPSMVSEGTSRKLSFLQVVSPRAAAGDSGSFRILARCYVS